MTADCRRPSVMGVSIFRPPICLNILLATLIAICGCLLEPSGDGGAVSDCPQSPDTGFKVSIDNYFIGVELDLDAVEKSLVAGNAGSYLIQGQ